MGGKAEKFRILICAGSRPEVIKLAPLYRMWRHSEILQPILCLTGQHQDLLTPLLREFDLRPDVRLPGEAAHRTLTDLSRRLARQLPRIMTRTAPDMVVVQGDTTSALMAAVTATRLRLSVAHVEAGLRTYDIKAPFPEEINRQTISRMTTWHFCPTADNRKNLLREGHPAERIFVTGNTGIDMLHQTLSRRVPPSDAASRPAARPYFLVTLHRRESHGSPLLRMLKALRAFAAARPEFDFVIPLHPNPVVTSAARALFAGPENIRLLPPLGHAALVRLMRRAFAIVTDSGGLQEEGPALNIPVIVLRDMTERMEGVRTGALRLAGTAPDRIFSELALLIRDRDHYIRMCRAANPFGDGRASARITDHLTAILTGHITSNDQQHLHTSSGSRRSHAHRAGTARFPAGPDHQ